jgi:hypothetical protein
MKIIPLLIPTLFLTFGATSLALSQQSAQIFPSGQVLASRDSKPKDDYGYSANNPIKTGGGPKGERAFLNRLAGPNGEPVRYQRLGSCCSFSTPNGIMGGGLLDRYEVWIEGQPQPKILYLNMYDFEEPKIPKGFTERKAN